MIESLISSLQFWVWGVVVGLPPPCIFSSFHLTVQCTFNLGRMSFCDSWFGVWTCNLFLPIRPTSYCAHPEPEPQEALCVFPRVPCTSAITLRRSCRLAHWHQEKGGWIFGMELHQPSHPSWAESTLTKPPKRHLSEGVSKAKPSACYKVLFHNPSCIFGPNPADSILVELSCLIFLF